VFFCSLQVFLGVVFALLTAADCVLCLYAGPTCLASLYRNQGKVEEAEETYWLTLNGYEKALGLDHTST
jgi:hypothetical protein